MQAPKEGIDFENLLEWSKNFDGGTPVDRLGAALFVNCDHPERRMLAMFTAYFDGAGNSKDQPFVVVTGYIANYLQWRAMESMWKEIHKTYDVDLPFHMTQLMAATTRPEDYAKQKGARQDYVRLAKDMDKASRFFQNVCIAQMNQINCGISCIVPMEVYRGVSAVSDLQKKIPPYALGARICIARIHEWEDQFDIQEPVECIFEEGDFGQGEFTKLMIDEGRSAPIYKSKEEFAGLQAADQYAWEQFHYLKKELTAQNLPARGAFKMLLNAIPKMHTVATREGLINLCIAKEIPISKEAANEAK